MTERNGRRLAYSVREAAGLLGVSPSSLYRAVEKGELVGVRRIGSRILISAQALKRWLAEGDDDEMEDFA